MYCIKCNTQIPENTNVCPNCGTQAVRNVSSVTATHNGPIGDDTGIMKLAIWAAVLFWTGIPGLVLAIIARSKSSRYLKMLGGLSPKARIGRIMATFTMVFSILAIVLIIGLATGAVHGRLIIYP